MDRSILRTGIPAVIVASVLGFSLLLPAAASRGNGNGNGNDDHGYGGQCGYGQVQDNDENGSNDQGGGGDGAKSVIQGRGFSTVRHPDTDCNEDENDNGNNGGGGSGGGGGGGDRPVSSTSFGSIVHVPTVAKPVVVVSNRLGSDGE